MKRLNRRVFLQKGAAAFGAAITVPELCLPKQARAAAETVRLGFIGVGGRGLYLTSFVPKIENAMVAAVCDPDAERLAAAKKQWPDAKACADMREIFDDPSIDAVVIATCNHWHCLAAVWAMMAGKDVYVEKPLGMNFHEGNAVVQAAEKYGKMCQIGTQMRSDPVFHPEVKRFLHEEKALGAIKSVRINRFSPRPGIGLRKEPLVIPPSVDYNLWLGPAPETPLYRDHLQYDWHWMWRTGHGETGNWGAHLIDDCRNDILLDEVRMPKRILAGGGRLGYNDAGESPNSMFVYFDTGLIPVVFCISNLPDAKDPKSTGTCPGPTSGYVAYCEGGRYEKYWGGAVAFDSDGKKIRGFVGTELGPGAKPHLQSFVDAVLARDKTKLNAPIEIGRDSMTWYNGANVAYRLGRPFSEADALAVAGTDGRLTEAIEDLRRHLNAQNIKVSADTFRMSDFLEIDETNQRYAGPLADQANALLEIPCRDGFAMPSL